MALPVGPAGVMTDLGEHADRVVHLETPAHLIARQSHYPQPREVDDDEISSPEEMAQAMREDSKKWGDVIRQTGTTINQ